MITSPPQTSICSWNHNSGGEHHDIHSVTITPDNNLVIVQCNDDAYEIPLAGLNTTTHQLTISEQHRVPSKWYQLDSMKIRNNDLSIGPRSAGFELARFDVIPPGCNQKGGYFHYLFRNGSGAKFSIYLDSNTRGAVGKPFFPKLEYSFVVDPAGAQCHGYVFLAAAEGKPVLLYDLEGFLGAMFDTRMTSKLAIIYNCSAEIDLIRLNSD